MEQTNGVSLFLWKTFFTAKNNLAHTAPFTVMDIQKAVINIQKILAQFGFINSQTQSVRLSLGNLQIHIREIQQNLYVYH